MTVVSIILSLGCGSSLIFLLFGFIFDMIHQPLLADEERERARVNSHSITTISNIHLSSSITQRKKRIKISHMKFSNVFTTSGNDCDAPLSI